MGNLNKTIITVTSKLCHLECTVMNPDQILIKKNEVNRACVQLHGM